VTIGSGVFGWLRVKVCIFPYTLKVVLTTLTLPCEVWYDCVQYRTKKWQTDFAAIFRKD